jgi:hypothetical protein
VPATNGTSGNSADIAHISNAIQHKKQRKFPIGHIIGQLPAVGPCIEPWLIIANTPWWLALVIPFNFFNRYNLNRHIVFLIIADSIDHITCWGFFFCVGFYQSLFLIEGLLPMVGLGPIMKTEVCPLQAFAKCITSISLLRKGRVLLYNNAATLIESVINRASTI